MRLIEGFQLLATAPEGTARLRELILSLSVMGKLVPQDPSDEPADALLKEIRTEKDRLIAEGKIRRDKPLPEIADEEKPFALPAGWAWARMQQISDARLGKMLDKAKNSGKPYPYLRNTNVQWHRFDLEDVKVINLEAHELDEYRLRSGDLLICEGGEPGRCAIWREQQQEMYFQKALHRVRPLRGILPEYLALCLENDAKSLRLEQYFTGATIKHFAGQELARYCVPLPPLAEQSRIVAKVDELMSLCDELETRGRLEAEQHTRLTSTLLEALAASESSHALAENWSRIANHFDLLLDRPEAVDALERTILQLAVRGLLVKQEPNDEPAGELLKRIQVEKDRLISDNGLRTTAQLEVPEEERYVGEVPGWQYCRLGNLARFIDYRGRTPQKVEAGVPLITAKNVRPGFISREPREYIAEKDYSAWMTRGFPRVGDLLFTTEAPLGNIALIDITERFALAQRVICFQLHDLSIGPYLQLAIMSAQVQEQLSAAASGMTATGIKASRLKEIPIAIPPLAEQRRIVGRVEELRRVCFDLRERLIRGQLYQTRLAEALVGQAASTTPLLSHTDDLAAAA
jgi:type I restriction enzyme, S subunit